MSEESNYECTAEIITDGGAKLKKFKSKQSGMSVCIAEVNGPLVGGYLCVATEAHDDDGLPHTLEHLIFMGSEKYPYKGILDLVASRCLAPGTNAWTDTDHTCYTMSTAGDEGFLQLLPIYLDHLLYPTLSENAFVTEVHHVNAEGEDAGVVYCEMQTRENSGESRCHLAMLRAMYPGHCGYKYETGGLLQNLRESTTNKKVIEYHKQFYRPENLCVIIVGQIESEKVFKALEPVEERISRDGKRPPMVRPWQSPVPPLPESVTLDIEYPSDEDEYGLMIAAWRGPLANDYSQLISIQILMDYLTDTSVSPLCRELVEIEDPLCNQVDYTVIENLESCIYLHLSNVPIERLEEVKEKLLDVLQNIADGKEELDMERMRTVTRKKKLYILSHMENSPHDALASCLIGDFLYGSTLEDLKHRVQEIPTIDKLFDEPPEFWKKLLKSYITEAKHVIVMGKPSPALSNSLALAEKKRVEDQQKALGPAGLKEKASIVKQAVEAAEVPPPKEVILSVAVPSVKSIKFHPIKRISNVIKTADDVEFSFENMPCRFEVDVIETNFVRIYLVMDTSHLSQEMRMFLPLFVELLDECAIRRNGDIVPYPDVVKELAEDTISISAHLGLGYKRFFCGKYAQIICLDLMVEEEKYPKSVQWMHEILYQIIFEAPRIKSTINKMLTDLAYLKRKGGSVLKTMIKNLIYVEESNHWTGNMLRQSKFLAELLKNIDTKPEEVISKLNEVRESVTNPEKMTVHLAFNLESLKKKFKPETPWIKGFLPSNMSPKVTNSPFKRCYELLQDQQCGDSVNGLISSMGSVETSYLLQCCPCLTSCTDPDYAPLLVLIQYLTQLEGPMYRQIRGLGLAYSYYIFLDPDTGLIYFMLSNSTHLLKAYKEALGIVESLLSGKMNWEQELFESGASSLVYEIIEKIKTVADVTEESMKAYISGVDIGHTHHLLEEISKVTIEDMQRVGKQYLQPLFDATISKCGVCCHPNKVNELVEGFSKLSRKLKVVSLDDVSFTKF